MHIRYLLCDIWYMSYSFGGNFHFICKSDIVCDENQLPHFGPFEFRLREVQENTSECTFYDFTNGDSTVSFKIIAIDTSI